MIYFEDLGDDLLYLILQHTGSDRPYILRTFLLVSNRLNYFAEAVLYRHITLQDDDQHELLSYRFIERLCNPYDTLCRHVRSLAIKSFKGDDRSYCMNMRLLSACLYNIQKLQTLSWDSDFVLTEGILNTFYQCAIEVQLGTAIPAYNKAILCSPQTRLSLSLPYSQFTREDSSYSLKCVKNEILQCHNLRSLSLDVRPDPSSQPPSGTEYLDAQAKHTRKYRNISEPTSKIQFHLEDGDRLPPYLEEFEIRTNLYRLDEAHCKQLLSSLNLDSLTTLRFGQLNPTPFFQVFTGQLPHLQTLDFTYHENTRFGDESNLRTCVDFLASIPALSDLEVRWSYIKQPRTFWRTLKDAHALSLRRLSVQAFQRGWDAAEHKEEVKSQLEEFSALESLDFALRAGDSRHYTLCSCSFCTSGTHVLNPNYASQIPLIPSLRNLHITILANTRTEQTLHSSTSSHAHCVLRRIWTMYANAPHDTALESATLTFWRWQEGSNLPTPSPSNHIHNTGCEVPRSFAHIAELTYTSHLTSSGLIIKPRNYPNGKTVHYKHVWGGLGGKGTMGPAAVGGRWADCGLRVGGMGGAGGLGGGTGELITDSRDAQIMYLAEDDGGQGEETPSLPPLLVSRRFHAVRGITDRRWSMRERRVGGIL